MADYHITKQQIQNLIWNERLKLENVMLRFLLETNETRALDEEDWGFREHREYVKALKKSYEKSLAVSKYIERDLDVET